MIAKATSRLVLASLLAASLPVSAWAALDPCSTTCGQEWYGAKQVQLRTLESALQGLAQLDIRCVESTPDDPLAAGVCLREVNRQRAGARTSYRKSVAELTTQALDCYRGCTASSQSQGNGSNDTP